MCRIPYTVRIEGRYSFRRRIHFRNLISKPVTLALQTANPTAARERMAILSARFVIVKAHVGRQLGYERTLTGSEIEAVFRHELTKELSFYLTSAYENAPWSSSVMEVAAEHGAAYRQLRLPDPRYDMGEREATEREPANAAPNWSGSGPDWARAPIDQIRAALSDDYVIAALERLGVPTNQPNIAAARTHMIRAGASACSRAQRLFDDDALDAADPMRVLMADLGDVAPEVAALLNKANNAPAPALTGAPSVTQPVEHESQFVIYDSRRFSEIIDEVLIELKQDKVWKGDLKQQRRIVQSFAWIAGDRELGSYDHRDVARFKNGLKGLPTSPATP